MALKLFNTHSLQFLNPTVGTYDAHMRWVAGTPTKVNTKGSLQPYRKGTETIALPEGMKSEDGRVYFCKTLLTTSDQFDGTNASTTVIGGKTFYVYDKEDFTGYGLLADHYKYYLVRESFKQGGT